MVREVWRTEVIEIKTHPTLDQLCYQTKNLYNRAMFLYKQQYQLTKECLSYQQLDKLLKKEEVYRILPAQTAQQTLKLLKRNWKSFYQAQKEFMTNPQVFLGKPQPPKYKPKNGQQIAIFTNQQVQIRGKKILFPKKVSLCIKTRLSLRTNLRELRIIPRATGYTIEVVYSKQVPELLQINTTIGAIDLGIHNLLTYVDNIGSRPIVVKDEGRGIKSILQFYLKETKKLQQKYANQQKIAAKKKNKLIYGRKFHLLREHKRRKVREWIHQMSRAFIELWVQTGIQQVFIGYNPTWKQQLRLRKKTTQLFVILPFDQFIHTLKYKAEEYGIVVERIEESYTSKCSFLDNEYPHRKSHYVGKRTKRGSFLSSTGILINADVNGAYNILLKGDPQALPKRSVGGVGGYVMYPLRWSFELQ